MASRFEWHPEQLMEGVDRMVKDRITGAVHFYEHELDRLFRATKSGRIYRVGKTPSAKQKARGAKFREHQASAPGEAPAIDTGALRRSVTHKIVKDSWAHYRATIGSKLPYAAYLEFGTRHIEPRPAWIPALLTLRAHLPEIFAKSDRHTLSHLAGASMS
jgi:phage gpG-like protein